MSADSIAPLGFEVDTSQLVGAQKAADQTAASLDKMGTAAEKAGAKAKQAAQGVEQAATAARNAGTAAGAAAGGMGKFGQEADKASRGAGAAGLNIKQLMELLKQSQGHAAGSGQAIQNLTGQLGTMAQTIGSGGSGALTGGLTNSIGLFGRLATTLGPVGGLVAGVAGGVAALGTGYVALNATLAAAQDRFALLEGRLKNVYGSGTVAKEMFAQISVLANKNAVAIDQTAESFLRLARNNEAIGLTRKQMVDLTDSVQMLGRVSGASTGELASGMLQFSQALASGRLNGDELRSIMENMPALAKAIAQGLGVSLGQIRAMGAAGELTGDKITKALLGQLPNIKKEFEELPVTTEQAFTRMGNAWDTMLATMGQKLNSSKVMQYLAGSVEGVINTINDAMRDETPDEARKRIYTDMRTPKRLGGMNMTREEGDAQLYDIYEQSRLSGILNKKANDNEMRDTNRAAYTQAQRVADEVDPARKKVSELTANIGTLEKALEALRKAPKGTFEPQEIANMDRYTAYIAQMKKQLEDALPALEKFNKATLNQRNDALKYGYGTDIGSDIRKLTGTVDSRGTVVDEQRATSSVIFQRTTAIEEQTGAINNQIEAEKKRAETIGQGGRAEREAEADAKAHELQIAKFGNLVNDKILKVVGDYRNALLQLSDAQAASAAKQALLNAQIDKAAAQAASSAIDAGGGSGAAAEAERTARRFAEMKKAASAEEAAALRARYEAEDQARRNSEELQLRQSRMNADMQRRIAGGMSPTEARGAQQEQEARQYSEGFSDAAQRELAYQTKLSELRAKDAATLRQQLDEKQRAAAMTQKEIELTAKGGLAAQIAIARERELNAIKASGLKISQEEIAVRLQLAEQAVLDADALSKAQRTANAYVQMWQDAGQAITGGLEQQFSKMLDGEKFKMKNFLAQIAKDIAMAVIRAQIIAPISNMFSDIGNGSLGTGGGGTVVGSIISSVARAVSGSKASFAANDNAVPTAPSTRAVGAAATFQGFPGGGSFATVGNYVARGAGKVDPRLADILKIAAERGGFDAQAFSGYRPGDPRFHGKGMATDVRLLDAAGKEIPNYQNAASFRSYEQFAQTARMVQMEKYPELADQFRWGGYFSGPKGRYGAADLMHFDLGGGNGLGMAGGSWASGLTAQQRKFFPLAESHGIDSLVGSFTTKMKSATTDVAKAMPKQFDPSLKEVGQNLAKSIDAKPIQSLVPALSQVSKNATAAAPALDGVGSSLGNILMQLLQTGLSALLGSANGNVFYGGSYTTAFAAGGLVNRPTVFPMARGAGLMGEAGPEAILPLKRGPDGKLGVGGGNGGGDATQVIINDMRSGGQQVEQQQERGPDGKRLIRLTIRDEVKNQMKNGVYDPEMRAQYGASRVLARR